MVYAQVSRHWLLAIETRHYLLKLRPDPSSGVATRRAFRMRTGR
jgi:hypothetical protein